jgi:hypothetical protein
MSERISESWQRSKIHNILLKRGLIDEKASYISDYTGGRSKSTLDMTYSEAMNLINFFEKEKIDNTLVKISESAGFVSPKEDDKSIRLRKDVFGHIYELNKVAPQLKIAVGKNINQDWLKDFFTKEVGKNNIYAMTNAERLQLFVKLKQMIAGYKKQVIKKHSVELERDYDYTLNQDNNNEEI